MIERLKQNTLDLKFCMLDLNDDGILVINIPQYTDLEFIHALKLWRITREVFFETGKPVSSCTIVGEGVTISDEAKAFTTSERGGQFMAKSAIVVNSWAHKSIANFIVTVKKQHPTKLFNQRVEAMEWLNGRKTPIERLLGTY